ncbi:MAG: metallophosphoesterase [Candidatus Gastranaerophilales bacterium]|nr:metallophosphoesterase [Candidatus Gastranaerophilales bacterium]
MKLLNKFGLLVFTLVILTVQTVYSREIKFVQITDSHFSATEGDYSQNEVGNSKSGLERTIIDINSIPNVDFVVFTGDNIDTANSKSLKGFLMIANRLKVPYYVVIGNHEVFKSQHLTKKDYMKIVSKYSKNCRSNSANYVFHKKGIVFLVVDGAKEVIPGPAGYYKKDTLKWLDKKLTHYRNSKVVIFQHFPIVAPYYNRTHTTYNTQDYEAILKKHSNVIAIVSGHYHANGEVKQNGIYHVSTPALVEPPHNYKVIEIETNNGKDCKIYTQLRHAE